MGSTKSYFHEGKMIEILHDIVAAFGASELSTSQEPCGRFGPWFSTHMTTKTPKTNSCLNRRLTYFVNFGTIFEFLKGLQEVFFQFAVSSFFNATIDWSKTHKQQFGLTPHPHSFGNQGAVQVKPGHPGCNPVGSALDPFG